VTATPAEIEWRTVKMNNDDICLPLCVLFLIWFPRSLAVLTECVVQHTALVHPPVFGLFSHAVGTLPGFIQNAALPPRDGISLETLIFHRLMELF